MRLALVVAVMPFDVDLPSLSVFYAKACSPMSTHYVYGAVEVCTGGLDSLILPQVNTACMQIFLDEVTVA